jgi:murein DD-endopeptidase MepM/ murein hydrolase activator NlpD
LRRVAHLLGLGLLLPVSSVAQSASSHPPSIVVRPAHPAPASLVWIVVRPARRDSILALDGEASGEPLHFEWHRGAFRSLAGISLDGGDSLGLTLIITRPGGTDTSVTQLAVGHRVYPSERLTVAPRFVEPDSKTQARIDSEVAQARALAREAHSTPRLWRAPFRAPRPGKVTSRFGTGREFNGRVTTRHLGTDFAGRVGAPVLASNRGVVGLVAHFYLAGQAVYLDHGAGLVTGYFHLSRIDVARGDTVAAGQVIGAVGRTGRATGPHLHWIARYGGITVDPTTLLTLPALPK